MTDVPIWLLDIDGVVNVPTAPSRRPPFYVWPSGQWRDVQVLGAQLVEWRIVAGEPVLDFLRNVHESGAAEIRWHTTWQIFAHNVSDALDLPRFPIHDAPEYYTASIVDDWWKLPSVWRTVADGRKILWTDDDANTELTDAQRHRLASNGCHIIVPSVQTGLTRRHLRQISEFLGINNPVAEPTKPLLA